MEGSIKGRDPKESYFYRDFVKLKTLDKGFNIYPLNLRFSSFSCAMKIILMHVPTSRINLIRLLEHVVVLLHFPVLRQNRSQVNIHKIFFLMLHVRDVVNQTVEKRFSGVNTHLVT